jgi:hypothetical protein
MIIIAISSLKYYVKSGSIYLEGGNISYDN